MSRDLKKVSLKELMKNSKKTAKLNLVNLKMSKVQRRKRKLTSEAMCVLKKICKKKSKLFGKVKKVLKQKRNFIREIHNLNKISSNL